MVKTCTKLLIKTHTMATLPGLWAESLAVPRSGSLQEPEAVISFSCCAFTLEQSIRTHELKLDFYHMEAIPIFQQKAGGNKRTHCFTSQVLLTLQMSKSSGPWVLKVTTTSLVCCWVFIIPVITGHTLLFTRCVTLRGPELH